MMSIGGIRRVIVVLGAQSLASDGAFKFHPGPDEKETSRSAPEGRRNVVVTHRTQEYPPTIRR